MGTSRNIELVYERYRARESASSSISACKRIILIFWLDITLQLHSSSLLNNMEDISVRKGLLRPE